MLKINSLPSDPMLIPICDQHHWPLLTNLFILHLPLASGHSQLHSTCHDLDALDFNKKSFPMFHSEVINFCLLLGPCVYFFLQNPEV